MEYLFAQTGKTISPATLDVDHTEMELSKVEEDDEDILDVDDLTVSALSPETTVAPATDAHEAVDADSVSGLGAVDALVECLIGLRKARVLSNQQALQIIRLWENLDPYDRQPSRFTPRTTARKDVGRSGRAAANSNAESARR